LPRHARLPAVEHARAPTVSELGSTEPIEVAAQPPAGPIDVERGDADPPENSPGGVDLKFRPDIEGLRAVSVIVVVLYHAGVTSMSGGFVGVDVFFVISGFLITGLLMREHEKRGKLSIPGFYARRARRILPAGMLVLIATVVAAYHYQNFLTYALTAQDARWAALFAANIHFANVGTDYQAIGQAPSPLLHYWSLGVEEQFYFVWPTIVLVTGVVLRRFPLRYTVLAVATAGSVASFIWAVHVNGTNATWGFFSPITRAWELGVGAMAATVIVYAGRLNKWIGVGVAWAGLGAIIWASVTYTDPNVSPGTASLVPVLGAVAIIVGGTSGIGAGHFLGLAPMRAVGRVSYGWYLLHYPPMILLAGALWQGPLPVHEDLLIAAVTLVLAFGMYYALERPIRRSRAMAKRPWASIAMGLACVAAAFLVAALLHKSLF
jgi:peptidoglycan/LPS O-acetylase OafA/YrhL